MTSFKVYARGIIKNEKGDFLLLKKKKTQKIWAGEWLLPGGTLEFWEDIEYTLIREIKEETNLEIQNVELLSSKKMLFWDTHWLGMYFLCTIKDETKLKNMEPEKHETLGFFPLSEIWDLKDYMMIKMGYNFPKEYFDITISDTKEHSMQQHLTKYVEKKVHTLIKENLETIKYIRIIWNYDRGNIVSKEEKNDKIFNYKRPTALLDGDILYISCFPWEDYIKHYANIIATYFHGKQIQTPLISYRLPTKKFIDDTFLQLGIAEIPNADTILFWNIDKIEILKEKKFKKLWDFYYKEWVINGKKVLLLGCEFSIWWNTGYYFINNLSKYVDFHRFIYIWKLWVLDKDIEPNTFIATGNISYIWNNKISWDNLFQNIQEKNVIFGNHITCDSVIEETIYNIWEFRKNGIFIDPEIWNMAQACNENKKQFSYLHIISDNVIVPHIENLSNERKEEIVKKRKMLFLQIGKIIKKYI